MTTIFKEMACVAVLITFLSAEAGCDAHQADQKDVQRWFSKHRVGSSPDCAVMKNGTDHLMTIHGYTDDCGMCQQLIAPYNKDRSLSVFPGVYTCVRLN